MTFHFCRTLTYEGEDSVEASTTEEFTARSIPAAKDACRAAWRQIAGRAPGLVVTVELRRRASLSVDPSLPLDKRYAERVGTITGHSSNNPKWKPG